MQSSNTSAQFPYRIRTLTKYTNMEKNNSVHILAKNQLMEINISLCDANIISSHRALAKTTLL